MAHHRNRFFVVRIECGERAPPPTAPLVMAHLRASIIDLHGDYGAGSTLPSLSMRFFDESSCMCAIRVDREFAEVVRTSIVLVTLLGQRETRLRVLHMVGNMRRCKTVLRSCLDGELKRKLAVIVPPREREGLSRAHREALVELDRTQL